MRILIADDDALSLRLLERTLERDGYEVTAVQNGRLAAEHLCRHDGPRLALLDWVMPELDGPAVCREVRQTAGPSSSGMTDRKSTRLNSSHQIISYAVFCLKKKKTLRTQYTSSKQH